MPDKSTESEYDAFYSETTGALSWICKCGAEGRDEDAGEELDEDGFNLDVTCDKCGRIFRVDVNGHREFEVDDIYCDEIKGPEKPDNYVDPNQLSLL